MSRQQMLLNKWREDFCFCVVVCGVGIGLIITLVSCMFIYPIRKLLFWCNNLCWKIGEAIARKVFNNRELEIYKKQAKPAAIEKK